MAATMCLSIAYTSVAELYDVLFYHTLNLLNIVSKHRKSHAPLIDVFAQLGEISITGYLHQGI
jgi:uncharacterized membrane protein YeiB